MRKVVHYGVCDHAYSSYLIHGFQALHSEREIDFKVCRRVPDDLRTAASGHLHMQMMPVFDAYDGANKIRFCVDNHDHADFVHMGLLGNVDHYFKLNHDPDLIDQLGLDPVDRKKVVPLGGPISPVRLHPWWQFLPALRPVPEMAWGPRDAVRRILQIRRLTPLDRLTELRSSSKDYDVVFVNRIYRQPHHKPINDFRFELASRLSAHPDINAKVGLVGTVSGKYERFKADDSGMDEHLRQLASSRVGIYVWGTHRCLSFKMSELLALGLPVAGQSIPRDQENLASLPYFDQQFGFDDPQSLIDAVVDLLSDDQRRHELARSNAEVFDSVLAPRNRAEYLANHVFDLQP